jgi:hypothetical protein
MRDLDFRGVWRYREATLGIYVRKMNFHEYMQEVDGEAERRNLVGALSAM